MHTARANVPNEVVSRRTKPPIAYYQSFVVCATLCEVLTAVGRNMALTV